MKRKRVNWTIVGWFSWGECLAAWHYTTPEQAMLRGAGIFVVFAALQWITNPLIPSSSSAEDSTP